MVRYLCPWLDGLLLPTTPALAVKCWTAGIYLQLDKLLKGARDKAILCGPDQGIGFQVDD